MKRSWIITLALLCSAACAQQGPAVPFPDADTSQIDQRIAELVRHRIDKHNEAEGSDAEKKIVAMGHNAVPTLIAMAKLAANRDRLVLHTKGVQDYGWELTRSVQMLVQIGDRRAIPLISALVKYDDPKPRRMASSLEVLLCHGSDRQIELDAKADDPNVARAARWILKHPDQFAYYKELYRKARESNRPSDRTW